MKKSITALSILTLAGCATTGELEIDKMIIQSQITQQDKPTLAISCSTGCKFDSLEYNDPNKRGLVLPKKTNAMDVAMKALDVVGGAVPSVIAGKVLVDSYSALSNRATYTDSYNQTATPTVVNQPMPTVVNQPMPTVVNQPMPTVVNQPMPIIIDPTVTVVEQPEPIIVVQPEPIIVTP